MEDKALVEKWVLLVSKYEEIYDVLKCGDIHHYTIYYPNLNVDA